MLQVILGYDEKSQLLIPPIHPGQSLPKEVLEYYESYCSYLKRESRFTLSSPRAAVEQRVGFTVTLRPCPLQTWLMPLKTDSVQTQKQQLI